VRSPGNDPLSVNVDPMDTEFGVTVRPPPFEIVTGDTWFGPGEVISSLLSGCFWVPSGPTGRNPRSAPRSLTLVPRYRSVREVSRALFPHASLRVVPPTVAGVRPVVRSNVYHQTPENPTRRNNRTWTRQHVTIGRDTSEEIHAKMSGAEERELTKGQPHH
jgi:hypothetical protein